MKGMPMADGAMNTEADLTALTAQAQSGAIMLWSEEKKKDFVKTFKDRARVTQFLLYRTASALLETSQNRRYVSQKHTAQASRKKLRLPEHNADCQHLFDKTEAPDRYNHYIHEKFVGGRSVDDLQEIAQKRADAILNELPPIRTATAVIMPDVAKMMDQRDKLLEEGRALIEEGEKECESISMADLDPGTTIKEFMELVEQRVERREQYLKKLDKIGVKGCDLEDKINKALFEGLPGLSDAVLKVVSDHMERGTMVEQITRRVEERVLFGDSKEALEMLEQFEKDELEVSDGIKAEFSKAVEALKLSGLRGKRREKKP